MSPVEVNKEQPAQAFSQSEVERFRRDGYLIARGMADEELLRQMVEVTWDGLKRQLEPIEYEADLQYPGAPASLHGTGGGTVRRLKHALSRHPVFTQWVTSGALLGRLRQLLGPDIVMPLAHHNCIMTKNPRFSSDTGWHQDIRYWSFQRPELISVWLALGEERLANGCLKLIPGTHAMDFARDRFDEQLFLRPDTAESRALIDRHINAELSAGDVLFFHARTFHAASRNHTGVPKFSLVMTFRPADNRPIPGTRSASMPELLLPALSTEIS